MPISRSFRKKQMKRINRLIPRALYQRIHRMLPVVCVDTVVTNRARTRFFLVRRANEPERGRWWLPGGRLHKNERLIDAARRKIFEEIGFRGRIKEQLGTYEYFSSRGYFPGMSAHTIIFVFLAVVDERKNFHLDSQSTDAQWFERIDRRLDPYVKNFLRLAGFR
jgi:colanic acid biosynthesis protein WcaH